MYVDGDWCTKYVWKPDFDGALGISFAEIYWEIPADAPQGIYRICHYGTRKTLMGTLEWLSYHIPDWWVFDMFGSLAAGLFVQTLRLIASLSETFSVELESLNLGRKKDFHGCSRSFLLQSS
jgi:neutral ceramidase